LIVFADHGSRDRSFAMLRQAAEKDFRIVVGRAHQKTPP
jgi:hypothetical protein